MDEYVYEELKDFMRSKGFSKKQSARIATDYTDSVVNALEVQLDIEFCFVYENMEKEEIIL